MTRLIREDLDLQGAQRVVNALDGVDPQDYVTVAQLGTGSGLPDPSGEGDGEWLMTSSGAAVWTPAAADLVPIADVGGYFTATDVEGALQELGAGGGAGFAVALETPSGTIDGSNADFTLSAAPDPSADLLLFRNGLLQDQGLDYTLSGDTVTFTLPPETGSVLLAGLPSSGGSSSGEILYTQITSTVNITGTTSAGATAVLSPGAITFDGSLVIMSVFCPFIRCDTAAIGDLFRVSIFEGSTEIGQLGRIRLSETGGTHGGEFFAQYRFAPTAGSHTYEIRCYVTSTSGTPQFGAGAGGTDTPLPAFVRFVFA